MSTGINLLDYKSRKEKQKETRGLRLMRLFSISLMFLVSAFSITFFILTSLSPLPELDKQHNAASLTLSNSIEDIVKLSLVKERVNRIRSVVDSRKRYYLILEDLEKKRPPGISFESLSIDENIVRISAVSSSLDAIGLFISEISAENTSQNFYSKVSLSKLYIISERGLFSADLIIEVL